jgi:hypothetical protein
MIPVVGMVHDQREIVCVVQMQREFARVCILK